MPSFHSSFCEHITDLLLLLIQGTCATGVWVLAHEAGHGAFSPQAWVNDTVGWIFHSALLVPYFSWKYTHASYVLGPMALNSLILSICVFCPSTFSEPTLVQEKSF